MTTLIVLAIAYSDAMALDRKLIDTEEELRIERRLRWQAEQREEDAQIIRRRLCVTIRTLTQTQRGGDV